MMLVFVLSIIFKMALYMIYVNIFINLMSFSTYELLGHSPYSLYLQPTRDALFYGGHPLLESGINNILPLLIISIVAACAYLLNNVRKELRFIPIVLLPLCVYRIIMLPLSSYLAHNIGTALIILAPCTYLIVKISLKNFSVDAQKLRSSIKPYAILAFAPLTVLFLMLYGSSLLSSIYYFHYVIIFIGCFMGVLRSVRANEKMLSEPKFIVISLAPVVITMFLILGSQQIARVIWRIIQFVSVNIMMPIVNFVANGLEWFFSLFYTHDPSSAPPIDFVYDPGSEIQFLLPPIPENSIYMYFLSSIFTIILAIVVYKVIFRHRKQKNTKKGLTEVRSHATSGPAKNSEKYSKHKHGFFTPRDPRMAVRYHYRQFLRLCAERGCPPEKGDTSEEINSKNKANFPVESMSKLRELYIKARYSEHGIEKSESKEAGELVKKGLDLFGDTD